MENEINYKVTDINGDLQFVFQNTAYSVKNMFTVAIADTMSALPCVFTMKHKAVDQHRKQ